MMTCKIWETSYIRQGVPIFVLDAVDSLSGFAGFGFPPWWHGRFCH
jgi:hypothetical protein